MEEVPMESLEETPMRVYEDPIPQHDTQVEVQANI